MLGEKEHIEELRHRIRFVVYIFSFALAIIGLRLAYWQIVEGEKHRLFSQENTLKKEKIPGPRGRIFDRNMSLLVDNRLQLDVTLTPQFSKDVEKTLHKLAEMTGRDYDDIWNTFRRQRNKLAKFSPVPVIADAEWEEVVRIETHKTQFSGIDVEPKMRRFYPFKKNGAHLLGYLSEVNERELKRFEKKGINYDQGDWIGRFGLEREWERYLRGRDGYRYVVVDAHGHRIVTDESSENVIASYLGRSTTPQPGKSLVLTIDQDLQETAAKAMEGKMGAVVALDPRTGEVLVMHSNPGFDPTILTAHRGDLWTNFIKNPYGPLRNKVIQDHYPPGSAYKIVTGLAGLIEGVVTPNTMVKCNGVMRFGKRLYHCHKQGGHGWVNLRQAIKQSCDVYFYQIATKLGIDQISEEGFRLGLGKLTGIRLYGEVPGNLPTEEWKKKTFGTAWLPGETLSASIGQGANLVTPLQLALAYATFANGGDLYRPYIVSKVLDEQGNTIERFTPQLLGHQSFKPEYYKVISQGLHDVVNEPHGTGYWTVRSKDVEISGKSSTVQIMTINKDDIYKKCSSLPFEKRHHAWFVGFAPSDKPEIVVATFGMHECGGSTSAGPVVKAVIESWHKKKQEQTASKLAKTSANYR